MGRKRKELSDENTGLEHLPECPDCECSPPEPTKKVKRKGLTEAHFHQGVTVRFDARSAAFNNVCINNPAYRDLTLELAVVEGIPCVKVISEKNPGLVCHVPMANVRYFIIEE